MAPNTQDARVRYNKEVPESGTIADLQEKVLVYFACANLNRNNITYDQF